MPEELFVHYKFKNRKSGKISEGYIRVPDIEKYAKGMNQLFDIHEYKIIERRIANKEEYEFWKPQKVFLTEE
ncbi:MAG: hypothetical protein KJ571_16730 [Bacteroidetes bacterium]|nr:hypothetical protein [Bacteroidota bacterium]